MALALVVLPDPIQESINQFLHKSIDANRLERFSKLITAIEIDVLPGNW